MPIGAVVADANVFLSAVVGKAALRVIVEHRLWSNDRDFEGQAVRRYTTAQLLRALEG